MNYELIDNSFLSIIAAVSERNTHLPSISWLLPSDTELFVGLVICKCKVSSFNTPTWKGRENEEIVSPSAGNSELSVVLIFMPGAGQKIAFYASPTVKNCACL